MMITRRGLHYPAPQFVAWRNKAVGELLKQRPGQFQISRNDYFWTFEYIPEDNRRRDIPAILDAIFHVLEKTEIVLDDCIIKQLEFKTHSADKKAAGMVIRIWEP